MNTSTVYKKIWNGMIPLEIQLSPADAIELLASATLPEPFQTFYLLVPRVSYIPFLTEKIKSRWLDPMFALSGPRTGPNSSDHIIKPQDMWFEYQGQPLKWHYPIGLLFDMMCQHRQELPWSLTLHVRKFPPATKLIPQPTDKLMQDMFMAILKEADFTRHGSTKRVMDLSKRDQMQLLDGLVTNSFEKFSAILSVITSASGVKAIPMRFYMVSDDEDSGTWQFYVTQAPVSPTKKDSSAPNTLADAFRTCYEIAESQSTFINTCVCVSHGVDIPWDTPVSWLADNMIYADCFLHIMVISRKQ